MKKVIGLALAASAALVAVSSANAAEGCGRGMHRGPHGRCWPNRGGMMVAAPGAWVVGNFYRGHGYWDGHRWYQHRRGAMGHWSYY